MAAGESLLRGRDGHVLLWLSAGWLTIQAGRLVLSPLLPTVVDDLGVTPFAAGVALTVLWGLYALCQFPSGRIADRLSRKAPVVAGLALALGGFAAIAVAPSYPLFVVAAAVVGLGVGLYPTAARALVSDRFVARRGGAFGVHTASGDVGGAVAAGLAVAALAVGSWRVAFLPVLAVLAGVALALHRLVDEPYRLGSVRLEAGAAGRRLAADPELRWLVVAYSLFAFTWQSAASFLPTFLQASKGLSPALAGASFAGLFLVGAAVKPLAGALGDRFRPAPVAAAALAVGAVALLALVRARTPGAAVGATLLFAVGLMGFPPVMQSHLMDSFPDGTMGADLGLARTVYIGVGSLGSSYVGLVAGVGGYDPAFLGLVGCLTASVALVVWRDRSE